MCLTRKDMSMVHLPTRAVPHSILLRTALQFPVGRNYVNKLSSRLVPAMEKASSCASTADKAAISSMAVDSRPPLSFHLSFPCTLFIEKGDITEWFSDHFSDAIVNPANEKMLGGGGADGAIHRAAGRQLFETCMAIPEVSPGIRCPVGEARITPGFNLPASHVIHTVGPIYGNAEHSEPYLRSAYRNSLRIAKENNIQYIAFPAISCGVYMYPYDEAAKVAVSTVANCAQGLKEVHFVLFLDEVYDVWRETAEKMLNAIQG